MTRMPKFAMTEHVTRRRFRRQAAVAATNTASQAFLLAKIGTRASKGPRREDKIAQLGRVQAGPTITA
jgi:hypothetical protein